jgi:hypothetical protein
VEYVETTVGQAAQLIGGWLPDRVSTIAPNTRAWLFVAQGRYAHHDRSGAPQPARGTLWVLAIQGGIAHGDIATTPLDLARLGTPVVIRRGQVPEIDAVRAPAQGSDAATPTPGAPLAPGGSAIAVGAPSLAGGVVRVPVSTTGSDLTPYTGFSIHLRWDPSLFSFASASSAGSVIPGSLFCPAARVDADGAGAIYACTAIGGSPTTTAGLLATVSLTPVGTGCSALHLFTYGGADNGDAGSGTYTIDGTSAIVAMATSDGSANQAGQVC